METMSQAEYARQRGVSRQYINKLVKERGLKTHGTAGRIDPAELDQHMAAPESTPSPASADGAAPAMHSDSASLTRARTAEVAFKAKQAELDYRARVGELIPITMVQTAMADAGVSIARGLDMLVQDTDALTEAALKGGAGAVRKLLRERVRAMRAKLAEQISLPEGNDIA